MFSSFFELIPKYNTSIAHNAKIYCCILIYRYRFINVFIFYIFFVISLAVSRLPIWGGKAGKAPQSLKEAACGLKCASCKGLGRTKNETLLSFEEMSFLFPWTPWQLHDHNRVKGHVVTATKLLPVKLFVVTCAALLEPSFFDWACGQIEVELEGQDLTGREMNQPAARMK